MRRLPLLQIAGDSRLQGRVKGESHFVRLAQLRDPPGVVVLEFDGIEVLTTSYFFAALWPFWTHENEAGPSTFPLVANASPEIEEELDFVMKHRRMASWRGNFDGQTFTPGGWVGFVDSGLSLALTRAADVGAITAVELSQIDGSNATAWNNRLVALHKQRLLRRRQSGRQQTYLLPWKDVDRG